MKEQLIEYAIEKYGEIFPCGVHTTFESCFTHEEEFGETLFWFQLKSGTSAIVRESHLAK